VTAIPSPVYLLAGGGGRTGRGPDPLLAEALSLAGKVRPSVAYLGVASGDDRRFFSWMAEALVLAGAGPVRLAALAAAGADPSAAFAILRGSDLIFLSGGDVAAGMECLRRREAIPLLRELHGAGKPVLGLSAGSIMLGETWLDWPDPDDDHRAVPFPCLGLAPLSCDTHAEDDDWAELRALVARHRLPLAYGIPSGAALRVTADGMVAARGKAVVRIGFRQGEVVRQDDLPQEEG